MDTAAAHVAAAVVLGDRVLVEVEAMDTGQSARAMPVAEGLLAQAGIGWRDLTGLGVGIGPGNFTGIRIAVAMVRGLALGLGVPVVGVSGFDALDPDGFLTAVIPAPRGMAYVRGPGNDPQLMALVEAGGPCVSLSDIPVDQFIAQMARLAAQRLSTPVAAARPAPLYVRAADAAPPRVAPPVMLG